MKELPISIKLIGFLVAILIMVSVPTGTAFADDIDDPAPPPTLTEFQGPFNSPSWEQNVDNGDGTFTYSQAVNNQSTPPHYLGPWYYLGNYGFGYYSWFDQDYGWQHTFPYYADPNLLILESNLTIRAWDVDSEVYHGYNGEYDGVSGDGQWLNPQYLQGTNGTWSVTVFNVDPNTLMDGELDVWLNIDMHHTIRYWATTVDYSRLDLKYTYTNNSPPFQPELSISPTGCVANGDDLVVNVTGPTPADPDGDPVTYEYRWFVDTGTGFYVDDEFAGRGDHTGNTVPDPDTVIGDRWKVEVTPVSTFSVGGHTVFAKGTSSEVSFEPVEASCNLPPVAVPNGPYSGNEGSEIYLDGSGSYDPNSDPLSYSWSVNSSLCSFDDPTSATPKLTCTDNGSFTVTLVVSDGEFTDSDTAPVTVNNVPPTLGAITPDPLDPVVAVDTPVGFSAPFTDPADTVDELYDCAFDWNGDGTVDETILSTYGTCNASHAFPVAGIYTVKLTVTDKDGGVSNESFYQYVVVYDPSAGFVTGGGWINSPEGAYKADLSLTGKANFGFVSKYKKGADSPTGNTEFQFHAGDLNFHSSSYEWLVVTGSDYAKFKGEGTINGEGTYKFQIWAGDNDPDTFRIMIWYEEGGNEVVVYDNGMDQAIGGGNIVVHTSKK